MRLYENKILGGYSEMYKYTDKSLQNIEENNNIIL